MNKKEEKIIKAIKHELLGMCLDKELEAEVVKTNPVSVCKDCGAVIEKTCNKRQFCDACAKRRHRKVKAEYIRNRRYRCRQIEG